MTDEERLDYLESRVDQVQLVNEMLFNFAFRLISDEKVRAAMGTGPEISDWIRMMASGREDQGDHIAAHLLERVSDLLKK